MGAAIAPILGAVISAAGGLMAARAMDVEPPKRPDMSMEGEPGLGLQKSQSIADTERPTTNQKQIKNRGAKSLQIPLQTTETTAPQGIATESTPLGIQI